MNNVEDIAKELRSMIDEAVRDEMYENVLYKERLIDLCERLIGYSEDAQNLYDNMKEEGLTFGTMEAEGYLRAFKYITDLLEDYHPHAN
jgi:hypothetical protein